MSFWDHTQLWEKMLLVLAGGMVCTLLFASSKLLYSNYRVRKYTKLAAARKAHLENVRNSRSIIQLKGDEIPFGIRALEAGVEVEGVVISRPASVISCPATPSSARAQSQLTLLGSDADSIQSQPSRKRPQSMPLNAGKSQGTGGAVVGRPQVYQPSPYLSLPPPAHLTPSGASSRSSTSSMASSPSTNLDIHHHTRRALSDPLLHADAMLPMASQSSTSTPQQSRLPLRSSPDPLTLAKLDGKLVAPDGVNGSFARRRVYTRSPSQLFSQTPSRTPSPPDDGQQSPPLPSVHESSAEEESSIGSESGQESDNHLPRRPQLLTAYSVPLITRAPSIYGYIPETAQGDLSLLHTHRLSHVAEVGQLLPRTRQSRVVSGASLTGTASISPATSGMFYSPAASDPVYALDIAVPTVTPGNSSRPLRAQTLNDRHRSYSDPLLNDNVQSIVESLRAPQTDVGSDEPATWRDRTVLELEQSTSDRGEDSDLDQKKQRKKLRKKRQSGLPKAEQ